MSSNQGQCSQSLLTIKLDQIKNLLNQDPEKHAAEISSSLLWIGMNHPEVLMDDSSELLDFSIKRLYFRDSWEFPDDLIPSDALTTILNSRVCQELMVFCGYVDPKILNILPEKMVSIRLAFGRHINVLSLIRELKCRRQKQRKTIGDEEHTSIHLRCGEVDLKNLTSLPDSDNHIFTSLFISDASDQNAAWIVQAFLALRPKIKDCIETEDLFLSLPRSKLTATGLETIAKGFYEACLPVHGFTVSSPYIKDDREVPGYKNLDDFVKTMEYRYNLEYTFCNDQAMTLFNEWKGPTELTVKYIDEAEEFADLCFDDSGDLCCDDSADNSIDIIYPKASVPYGPVLTPAFIPYF
ncbi:unnamed protein product [Meganyctiphanes norvegica]|uniref:Uncharacterized protein n=1 Tax=Meganyctiphanes norvegica TaxID=48144 RepID=A0AAV2QQ98_MEGNR